MRVLQVCPTSGPGGAESIVISLSGALAAYGIEVVAASSGTEPYLYEKLSEIGVPTVRLKSAGPRSLAGEIGEVVKCYRPDIVHSHMWDANLPAALAGFTLRLPVVLTVHSTVYELESLKRRIAYALLSRWVPSLIAVSDSVASELIRSGAVADKVRRIHNGTDVSRFARRGGDSLRLELGIPSDAPVAGMIANLRPAKDHALLIEAAAQVIRRIPDAHFIITGDGCGTDCATLTEHCSRLGVGERVHLAGFRDDIPAALGALDVFVLATKIEGLPVSVIEAMAAGLPVVASHVGGVHELVEEGVTGYLVPAGNRDALADCVTELLSDSDLRARFGEAGCRRAGALFSLEAMAAAHRELYTECIAAKGLGE
ncbi:MAG: glycosyltransferase [Armatimonadetes bacterium]|nr:glycosyltransferase [Armatimonadota bacterium]